MAFSEFKQKLSAFNTSHFHYVEKQKTLRDSTMWNDSVASGNDDRQVFAVLPPVEYFMNLPSNIKKQHFFQSISCADCFIGEVSAIQASGLILRILCMEDDLARDLDHTNVAVVPLKSLPVFEGRGDPLAAFQLQDRVRAVIVDIDVPTHRIWASMNPISLRSHQLDIKLGLIHDDELPQHYREMVNVNNKSYEECLKDSPQFNNKGGVDRICSKLGIDVIAPASLMHAVNKTEILPHQFADEMRKKQTYKLALKHVAKGVAYFREKKHTEAMQCFNYALSVDKNHVEGLVARGALYATLSSFKKAMEDLELALEVDPSHKDAANYLSQVLVVYGRQRMDSENLAASEAYFQRALKLNPWMEEAKDAMIELRAKKLEKLKPKLTKAAPGHRSPPSTEMKRAHDTLLEIMRSEEDSNKPPDANSMWEEEEKAAQRVERGALSKSPFSRRSALSREEAPPNVPKELPGSPSGHSHRSPVSNREYDRSPVSQREQIKSPTSRREDTRSPLSRRGYDRSPAPRREQDRSPMSRRGYNRSPAPRRGYDRSPAPRRGYDRSPGPRREYNRSPAPRRVYDRSPGPRREYDRSPMSRRGYDRSPAFRREYGRSPMSRQEDAPMSFRAHDQSTDAYQEEIMSDRDYARSSAPRDAYRSPLSRHEQQPPSMSRQEFARPPMSQAEFPQSSMSREEFARLPMSRGDRMRSPGVRQEPTMSRQELSRSPYLHEAHSRAPYSYQPISMAPEMPPGPSVPPVPPPLMPQKPNLAYDPADPSDTNFFIYAEQDGLFQSMKGNKALTSEDVDNRFLIVKNSFTVAKPQPPQGPRFMPPSSPDPLPGPPAPPTVGQTSFGWLRTKSKPGLAPASSKPSAEAVKAPVEVSPPGNPFAAGVPADQSAAPRPARSHPFMRREKRNPEAAAEFDMEAPGLSADDSKGLVVEVKASEEGERRRVIKRRSPDAPRNYRKRSRSRSRSPRSPVRRSKGPDLAVKAVSGDDEHAMLVNAFLSKLSARDEEEARARDRARARRNDSSRERSLRGRRDDSPKGVRSGHSRSRESPRDDRSRRRDSPRDSRSRRRDSPRDSRSRRRDSPRDSRSRRRDSPRDDRSRRRDSPRDERFTGRRQRSPMDSRSRVNLSPWDHLFSRDQLKNKEECSGEKQAGMKKDVNSGVGDRKGSSKQDQTKSKRPGEVAPGNKNDTSKQDQSSSRGMANTREALAEEDYPGENYCEGEEEGPYGDFANGRGLGRGEWRGGGGGEWRGHGRGELRGRGRGDWRGRGRGEWRGRGRGEWRGRGRGTDELKGRGRGRGRGRDKVTSTGWSEWSDFWRGRTDYASYDDWKKIEEKLSAYQDDQKEKDGSKHEDGEDRRSSKEKHGGGDDDPLSEDKRAGGKRKLFLPTESDFRNLASEGTVPSSQKPPQWSPKRWANVQQKIRAIEARKSRLGSHSPRRVETPKDSEYMITRGHSPKSGGSRDPKSWIPRGARGESKALAEPRTPPSASADRLGPASPDELDFLSKDVEVKETMVEAKEGPKETFKGKVAAKKGPTRSLAQMENFLQELKAKAAKTSSE